MEVWKRIAAEAKTSMNPRKRKLVASPGKIKLKRITPNASNPPIIKKLRKNLKSVPEVKAIRVSNPETIIVPTTARANNSGAPCTKMKRIGVKIIASSTI